MNNKKLISIITVTLNSERTLLDTLQSVANQNYPSIEHIIKDGGSSDATLSIANTYSGSIKVVELPDIGIYDAMNQGFFESHGEIIGFLNSDDYLSDQTVLTDVASAFEISGADIVYGDLDIVNSNGKLLRRWRSGAIKKGLLSGQQLPHPSFFVRRELLKKLDRPFDPSYRISADFKQQIFLINKLGAKTHYLPRAIVKMRHGGESSRSFRALFKGWIECMRAYHEVTGKNGLTFVLGKVMRKLTQIRFL